jgi:hypothetical protein
MTLRVRTLALGEGRPSGRGGRARATGDLTLAARPEFEPAPQGEKVRKQPPRAASRRRSVRIALLAAAGAFLVAQLALGVAAETVKPEWRDPEYGHRLKRLRDLRAKHSGRPVGIAVGTSRTLYGLSPRETGFPDDPAAPLVYNFGTSAGGPLRSMLTVLRLLDDGMKPDFFLLEFFPGRLVQDGPAEKLLSPFFPNLGLADLRRLEPYCEDASVLRREWAARRVVPCYSLRDPVVHDRLPACIPVGRRYLSWEFWDPLGWAQLTEQLFSDEARARWQAATVMDYQPVLQDFHLGATSDWALRDTLARCRSEGIPVALYLTPEGPTFRSWYTPETKAKLTAYTDSLAAEYGVPLFDAADGFTEGEFIDGHHLLYHGATRFSRRLAVECVRPWVRGGFPPATP